MNSVFFHLQRGPIIDKFILDINISGWIDILKGRFPITFAL